MSDAVLLAAISALTGGVALEIVRRSFGARESSADDLIAFRRELVRENHRLADALDRVRQRLASTEALLGDAQQAYQDEIEKNQRLRARIKALEHQPPEAS